jgi:deoxyribonuclease V
MIEIRKLHPWNVTHRQAIEIQTSLCRRVVLKKLPGAMRSVAGTDVSFSKKSRTLWAGIVVLSYPGLQKLEAKWVMGKTDFPYIPGLLSFREVPLLLQALMELEKEPDVIMCDGQGIAHPRGMGLASHLGILTAKPTIGCAKKRLVGKFSEVGPHKCHYSYLFYKGERVGAAVRTKNNVKPVFISPGNAITIEEAVEIALNCTENYRIPEPVRQAHLFVNQIRREQED